MSEVEKALAVIRQAMLDDGPSDLGSFAHGWHCNIAMMCYDAINAAKLELKHEMQSIDAHAVGNDAASRFMKLCFGVETTDNTMSKREQLEKNVVDTKAAYDAYDAAYDAAYAAYAASYADYAAYDAATYAAYAAWVKAKLELKEYLKEQQDNE